MRPDLDTDLPRRWRNGIACPSQALFAMAVSLCWAVFYNATFWQKTAEAMWYPRAGSAVFFLSLFLLLLTLQSTFLLLVPTRRGLQIAASALCIIAALSAYFTGSYGALMNAEMMRNVFQTDPAEVRGLVSPSLILHFVLLALLPVVLIWRVRMPASTFLQQLKQRGALLGIAWLLCAGTVLAASASYAVFLREHKPLRSMIAPAAALLNSISLAVEGRHTEYTGPLLDPGGTPRRAGAPGTRPIVLFLVIGETARAANFELGGYARPTNAHLKAEADVVYFDKATSCGTSTATSVPCIFSPFARAQFNLKTADHYVNLLDTLKSAGIDVQWRDNNAGCKGVCKRIDTVYYPPRNDPALCPNGYCFDEVMLKDLADRLQSVTRDTVIVFHQIGSHGPAYSERYPPAHELFKPVCRSNELHRCAPAEIVNAYDNSIAYTDFVLSRQIDLLRAVAGTVDGVLLYASDHGESLGEDGVYLHGMPYAIAPKVQTEIPLILWTSAGYRNRFHLDAACLSSSAHRSASHDDIYHTTLGIFGVTNKIYASDLDLLASCRSEK